MSDVDDYIHSRFQGLEIDDDPAGQRRRREETEAAERRRHEEAVAEEIRRRELDALRRRTEEEAAVAESKARATRARAEAATVRSERGKAAAQARRELKRAHDDANNRLHKANLHHYWDDLGDGIQRMYDIMAEAGFEPEEPVPAASGSDGRVHVEFSWPPNGEKHYLHLSYFRMPSGRWEVVAYTG